MHVLGVTQEVSELRFLVQFQAVKVPIFGGFPVENPTQKATTSKLFKGEFLCPSTVRRGFQLRLTRLSEHGSVACLVERPTWETQAEQYSDTILVTDFSNMSISMDRFCTPTS